MLDSTVMNNEHGTRSDLGYNTTESLEREDAMCEWDPTPPSQTTTGSTLVHRGDQQMAASELTETQFRMLDEDFHSIFETPPSGLDVMYMIEEFIESDEEDCREERANETSPAAMDCI